MAVPTRALYLLDPFQVRAKATIIANGAIQLKGREYQYISCDQTIFHPQGGGQPSDRGTINGIPVDFVAKHVLGKIDEFEVRHCFANVVPFQIGEEVSLEIDPEVRRVNMRMHTAGHLIAQLVEHRFPFLKATGGNHSPEDGYMRFRNETPTTWPESEEVLSYLREAVQGTEQEHLPAAIVVEEGVRKLKIGNGDGVPCGGTHLTDVADVGEVVLGPLKVNKKESTLTIKYGIKV